MPENFQSSYLEDLVRQHDRDRYVITMFAPPPLRPALMTLLAFNVEVARIRETVSEPLIGQMRLQWWRDVLQKIGDGGDPPKGHPVAEAVSAVIASANVDPAALVQIVDAREADMSDEPPETLDKLIEYCVGTSGTLHRGMVSLVAEGNEADTQAAHTAGVAWALTGLVRATPLLAAVHRTLLPADLLAQHGLDVHDLQKPETAGGLRSIVQTIADTASGFVADARAVRRDVSPAVRPLLLIVPQAERYLSLLKKAHYDIYDPRVAAARPSVARLWWHAVRKTY